jgi:hypothetical protein
MALVLIGYWQSTQNPEWPDPRSFVDPRWDEGERDGARLYFSSGTVVRAYLGLSSCRFCGKNNGSREFTDGRFVWPEGLSHYLDEHSVRLPQPIVEHALRRLGELEDEPIDQAWWQSQTAF